MMHNKGGENNKMRKNIFILPVLIVTLALVGCGKKQSTLEEAQEPVSIETLTQNTQTQIAPDTKVPVTVPAPALTQEMPQAAPSLSKPTVSEIQAALKNAGLYTGEIDGKKGPRTKKAIEDFQRNNGLNTDGKVGPKTWTLLSAYLNPVPAGAGREKKR